MNRPMSLRRPFSAVILTAALCGILNPLVGCRSTAPEPAPVTVRPDYDRQLPAGHRALRRVTDPASMPDLLTAMRAADALLIESLDQSLRWFAAPSSRQHFPFTLTDDASPHAILTHERARQSVAAFRALLTDISDPNARVSAMLERFDIYQSVGYDQRGTVLYTGYYAPEFPASAVRTARFTAPLYRRPADLVTDPVSGTPLGRKMADGSIAPWPPRGEIERSGMLEGTELVWLESKLDAFLVHVNGSAKLRMTDGTIRFIGYDGKTDLPYGSLGRAMMDAGLIPPGEASVPRIRQVHRRQPAEVEALMDVNQSFVFFTEYPEGNWPAGSLGVRVTADASLATDKRIYPRGGVVLADTKAVTFSRGQRDYLRFLLDQDTGGAISAPGRADIFMGIGETVGVLAGEQYAEGKLWYFFLKPEFTEVPAPR